MIKVIDGFIEVCRACTRVGMENGRWERVKVLDYHDQRQYTTAKFNHGLVEIVCPSCQKGKTARLSPIKLALRLKE